MTICDTQIVQEFCKNYAVLTSGFLQVQEFFFAEVKRLHDPNFVSSYFKRQLTKGDP